MELQFYLLMLILRKEVGCAWIKKTLAEASSFLTNAKHLGLILKVESLSEDGEFSGYAAIFGNVDSVGDVIEKGALTKTIREDFDRNNNPIKLLNYFCRVYN